MLEKVSTFFSFNVWALCPSGYYLNGLRLSAGYPAYLLHIDEGQCCHPQDHPNSYEHCYDEDVTASFNHQGWSTCKQPGYYMTGLYKSNCNNLYCIETFKCCKMKKGIFIHCYSLLNLKSHAYNFLNIAPINLQSMFYNNRCFLNKRVKL